ncbi:MAG: HNH endonuclease [Anaerolineaceae bacterium]|jgi:hypothetical protein|nr:HNH endonuclease [Anaerolineaceae bacterium]
MTDIYSTIDLPKEQLEIFNQAIAKYDTGVREWIMLAMRSDYLTVNSEGYLIFYQSHHPLASSNGSVRLHRHIISKVLKRWVTDDEIVVFINGDKRDFSILNLEVTTRAEKASRDFKGKVIPERRKFDPAREELEDIVWRMPVSKVGEWYGISGRAVKKRCVLLGIETPPRGYWTMLNHGYTHDGALEELERRSIAREKR